MLALTAAWTLMWTGAVRVPSMPPAPCVIQTLFKLWREAASPELRSIAGSALSCQPVLPRDTIATEFWATENEEPAEPSPSFEHPATLITAWYRRGPWSDSVLAEKIRQAGYFNGVQAMCIRTFGEILLTLGDAGRAAIEEWQARRT